MQDVMIIKNSKNEMGETIPRVYVIRELKARDRKQKIKHAFEYAKASLALIGTFVVFYFVFDLIKTIWN